MNVSCERKYSLQLDGKDADVLMNLLQKAVYFSEDLIKELEKEVKVDASVVEKHKKDISSAEQLQEMISRAR